LVGARVALRSIARLLAVVRMLFARLARLLAPALADPAARVLLAEATLVLLAHRAWLARGPATFGMRALVACDCTARLRMRAKRLIARLAVTRPVSHGPLLHAPLAR
jgi:hypothetical protein